ncbi:hypothetical protein NQ317_019862, partial [Molorchus minor]
IAAQIQNKATDPTTRNPDHRFGSLKKPGFGDSNPKNDPFCPSLFGRENHDQSNNFGMAFRIIQHHCPSESDFMREGDGPTPCSQKRIVLSSVPCCSVFRPCPKIIESLLTKELLLVLVHFVPRGVINNVLASNGSSNCYQVINIYKSDFVIDDSLLGRCADKNRWGPVNREFETKMTPGFFQDTVTLYRDKDLTIGSIWFLYYGYTGCSPSISQGMRDLTQGMFEFIEESLNDLPSIRTLKCFSINTVRLWKPVLEHLKLQTESMDEVDRRYTLI